MEVSCKFINSKWFHIEDHYTCKIHDQKITESVELKFVGEHQQNKTNADVAALSFHNCDIQKVPKGLTKIFPNLQWFEILKSQLIEVKNEDLVQFKNLKALSMGGNLIEFLPADLFKGIEKELKFIEFGANKLKVIEPTILDEFPKGKQKHVNFRGNPSYTKCYSVFYPDVSNATIAGVKNELSEKYRTYVRRLQAENNSMKLQIEERDKKIKILEETNTNLSNEIKTLQLQIEKLKIEKDAEKLEERRNFDEIQSKLLNELENLKIEIERLKVYKSFAQTDEVFKDFTITIDEKEFHVHKLVIAAQSPTFAEILRNNPEAERLNATGISAEIFEKILNYFYSDELPNCDNIDLAELFDVSARLKVDSLKEFAGEKLINQLQEEKALKILKLSIKHGHESLRQKAFDEIKKKHSDVEFEDEWMADLEKFEHVFKLLKEKERIQKELNEMNKRLQSK